MSYPSLPIFVLLNVAVAAQAPNLQPPVLLPGTAVVAGAAEVQQGAALAAGSGATLLVFEDKRAGSFDLFGMRIDASGIPLDPLPFPIAKDAGDQTKPQVAWNGQDWLVVYSNQVDPGSGYFAYQVAARRISLQGVVRDAAPIALALDSTGGGFAVASDGGGWAVLFTGYSAGNSAVACRRVAADGTIVDPTPVVVAPATYYVYFDLGAVFVGGNYLFTWSGNSGFFGRRFTPTLQPIDPQPTALSPSVARVASSGASLYLVWLRQNPQFVVEVAGQRFGADLRPLDPAPVVLAAAIGNDQPTNPNVVFSSSQWIVAWQHFGSQNQRAARVALAGAVLDPGGVGVPDNSPGVLYGPALGALSGGGALLAWHDGRYGASEVFGTAFRGDGTPGSERDYSVGAEALSAPRVAPGAQQLLVTFKGQTAAGSRILVQRTDAFGEPIDREPIEVARAGHTSLSAGAAAWNGAVYLVTWSDLTLGRILGRRLRSDGTFVDAAPIYVMAGGSADVAALGDLFLVTGLRAPFNPQYVQSFAARVRGSDGAVLDAPALPLAGVFATRARAAVLGSRWLVATESHVTHDSNQAYVLATFVDAAGAVSAPASVGFANIQDWGSIDVAVADASALFLWQSGSNWTNTDLFARRMLADGSLPGTTLALTGGDPGGQSRGCLAWTGDEFVVAYQTLQNNVWPYDLEPDVYGVRVTADGVLRDRAGFALFTGADHDLRPDVASLGFGRALFAGARYVDRPYAAFRIGLRSMWPDGVEAYGGGTPGCSGPQRMFASGRPTVGNAGFAAWCDRAPLAGFGALLLGAVRDAAGTVYPSLGLRLHVGLAGPLATLPLAALGDGQGRSALALPANPSLRGARLHLQCVWPWGAACPLPPLGLSASDGLQLTLQ